MMRKIINELILKYGEYISVIINADYETLCAINNMPTEMAISKLEELKQKNQEDNKKDESPQVLYYSQC